MKALKIVLKVFNFIALGTGIISGLTTLTSAGTILAAYGEIFASAGMDAQEVAEFMELMEAMTPLFVGLGVYQIVVSLLFPLAMNKKLKNNEKKIGFGVCYLIFCTIVPAVLYFIWKPEVEATVDYTLADEE